MPTLAEEASTTTADCVVRRVQGDVEVCIPELNLVSTRSGYASVSWLNSTTAQFTVGFVNTSEPRVVKLVVRDAYTDSVLCSAEVVVNPGESKTVACNVGNSTVVLYSLDFGGGEVVEAALVVPRGGLSVPSGVKHPLVVVLATMVPVALFLSFMLTSDPREGAVMAGASMFAIYALASYVAPDFFAPWLTVLVGLLFLFALVYYLSNR
ncbi:MAG: hypothetical protein QXM08_07595 [Thermofilaceae archaeon]